MFSKFYRTVRHETRVRLSFTGNSRILQGVRSRIRKEDPGRPIIAIMLLEHLGDIVACEPVARYLKQGRKDAYLVWGVKHAYREIVEHNPSVDMTLDIHCLSERLRLVEAGLFDEVIDLHFHDRYCSLCSRPLRKTHTEHAINLGNYFSFGGILSALSLSAGLPALDEPPRVYIPAASVHRIDSLNLPDRFIAVNCSSNAREKDWPAAKWTELADLIMNRFSVSVVEVGNSPVLSFSGHPKHIDLCGRLSILDSAEVIRRASLFIGIDSGPAHIANAVGTYGLVLMGSYLGFERYNPFSGGYGNGRNAEIIHQDGSIVDLPVDRVFASAKKALHRNNA